MRIQLFILPLLICCCVQISDAVLSPYFRNVPYLEPASYHNLPYNSPNYDYPTTNKIASVNGENVQPANVFLLYNSEETTALSAEQSIKYAYRSLKDVSFVLNRSSLYNISVLYATRKGQFTFSDHQLPPRIPSYVADDSDLTTYGSTPSSDAVILQVRMPVWPVNVKEGLRKLLEYEFKPQYNACDKLSYKDQDKLTYDLSDMSHSDCIWIIKYQPQENPIKKSGHILLSLNYSELINDKDCVRVVKLTPSGEDIVFNQCGNSVKQTHLSKSPVKIVLNHTVTHYVRFTRDERTPLLSFNTSYSAVNSSNHRAFTYAYYTPEFIADHEKAMAHWLDFSTLTTAQPITHFFNSNKNGKDYPVALSFDLPYNDDQTTKNIYINRRGYISFHDSGKKIYPFGDRQTILRIGKNSLLEYYDDGQSFTVQFLNVAPWDGEYNLSYQMTLTKLGNIIIVYKQLPENMHELMTPYTPEIIEAPVGTTSYFRGKLYDLNENSNEGLHHLNLLDQFKITNETTIILHKMIPACNRYTISEASCSQTFAKISGCTWCSTIERCVKAYDTNTNTLNTLACTQASYYKQLEETMNKQQREGHTVDFNYEREQQQQHQQNMTFEDSIYQWIH